MDPAAAKLWTLSASDMNDEDMVSGFLCEIVLFLLSPHSFLFYFQSSLLGSFTTSEVEKPP